MEAHLARVREAVIGGRHRDIEALVREALEAQVPPDALINGAMIPAMDEVGRRFSEKRIFVPEMLVAAMTMKKGLDLVRPVMTGEASAAGGKVVLCTVKGDVHDIGKNLVKMMLEGAGFQVTDLGVDLSVETLLERLDLLRPDILGLSALLTTTMPEMARVITALEEKGLRRCLKVMVGGAPVDEAFARRIGADAYGRDAVEAVRIAKGLLGTP